MIHLTKMTTKNFHAYLDKAIERYANEIIKSGHWDANISKAKAQAQFQELLPSGLASPNQHFFDIVLTASDKTIGMIWYMLKEKNNFKEAFICDFMIDENYQNQGFGSQTIEQLLLLVKESQINAVGLFVFRHNQAALTLYEKFNFQIYTSSTSGFSMRRWFNTPSFYKTCNLKNKQALTISYPEPEQAQDIINYLNLVGGESDYLLFGKNEFPTSAADEAKIIANWKSSGRNLMLRGLINNEVVSVLTLNRPNRPRLKHLGQMGISVRKDYWNLGVGSQMISSMFEWIKENALDLTKITFEVVDENKTALALYEKFGFKKEGLKTRCSYVNGKYYNNVIMGMEL